MHAVLSQIEKIAIVPALLVPEIFDAEPLVEALVEGGLPCAEVTLRSPSSMDALKRMAAHSDKLLVGAGTVLNILQADEAIAAGAKFIVTPGMDEALIKHCQYQDVLIIPGASTPTEIMLAINLGVECVKFFPAHVMGGLPFLKALHGPFPKMRFMPTGGINREAMSDYLGFPPVLAVGGTWMIQQEWLDTERYDIIADACAVTMDQVKRIRRARA